MLLFYNAAELSIFCVFMAVEDIFLYHRYKPACAFLVYVLDLLDVFGTNVVSYLLLPMCTCNFNQIGTCQLVPVGML